MEYPVGIVGDDFMFFFIFAITLMVAFILLKFIISLFGYLFQKLFEKLFKNKIESERNKLISDLNGILQMSEEQGREG